MSEQPEPNHSDADTELLADLELVEKWWDPEPGEVLLGTIAAVGECTSRYNDDLHPLWVVVKDGVRWKVAGRRVKLHDLMVGAGAGAGDRVAIKYRGPVQGKSGKSFHDYTLSVKHADFTFSGVDNTALDHPVVTQEVGRETF